MFRALRFGSKMSRTASPNDTTSESHAQDLPEEPSASEADDICPNAAKGQPCSYCDEANSLEEEISLLETRLSTLKAKRFANKTKKNNAHDTLTSRFPVEVIAKIFTNFLPPEKDYNVVPNDYVMTINTTPLLFGAVSNTWRAIAWSTPQLWTSISINMYNDHQGLADIVRAWLDRSRTLPLCVHLYAQSRYIDDRSANLNSLIAAINAYSARWVYLDIWSPNPFMKRVISAPVKPRLLKILKLWLREGDLVEQINIAKMSNLERLSIRGLQIAQIATDWTQLTHIDAVGVTVPACYDLFRKSPFLTHCSLRLLLIDPDDVDPAPGKILQHRGLTFLQIASYNGTSELLASLELPALERLEFATEVDPDDIFKFLLRSSDSSSRKTVYLKIANIRDTFKERVLLVLEKIPWFEVLRFEYLNSSIELDIRRPVPT